jgi:hypothetical protein
LLWNFLHHSKQAPSSLPFFPLQPLWYFFGIVGMPPFVGSFLKGSFGFVLDIVLFLTGTGLPVGFLRFLGLRLTLVFCEKKKLQAPQHLPTNIF